MDLAHGKSEASFNIDIDIGRFAGRTRPTPQKKPNQETKKAMKIPAISIKSLTKKYGDLTAVNNLSLEVKEGEFFGFLGPNGAGKTTTINSIVGLVNFQHGNIGVFGHDVIRDFRNARRLIGLSPQEFNFDRYLTVEEILVYQAGYYGIKKKLFLTLI